MITMILSFLVFILAQECAVCDDLYPISVLRGIIENQVEGSSDINENNTIEARALPYVSTNNFIKWIQKFVVKKYKFRENNKVKPSAWKKKGGQPTFGAKVLSDKKFRETAEEVEYFFKNNINWQRTKTRFSPSDVLYLTAARYLLVTYILYKESPGRSLIPCEKLSDGRYQIPAQGVCYPVPYGSAEWSSDYDVGLIGTSSGIVTKSFNDYFKRNFYTPSELVFDTNIYAFTLEYAMPFMFEGLPKIFVESVAKIEGTVDFKMQELAGAYYKVYKYSNSFFKTLKTRAQAVMASQSKMKLDQWLKTFENCNNTVPLRLEDFKDLHAFRDEHNKVYQYLVEKMSLTMGKQGYQAALQGDLAIALIYAAEAYHTRGAIRHVVGGTQMEVMAISPNIRAKLPLSTYDLWVSMIENWGESNKEYKHCKDDPLKKCFLKMCKYMWRMFNAMRLIRGRMPARYLPGLVHFGEADGDPEYAMKMWLAYKKQPKTKRLRNQEQKVRFFLRQFHCDGAVANIEAKFNPKCISKMNDAVNLYNVRLAQFLTNESDKKPAWKKY